MKTEFANNLWYLILTIEENKPRPRQSASDFPSGKGSYRWPWLKARLAKTLGIPRGACVLQCLWAAIPLWKYFTPSSAWHFLLVPRYFENCEPEKPTPQCEAGRSGSCSKFGGVAFRVLRGRTGHCLVGKTKQVDELSSKLNKTRVACCFRDTWSFKGAIKKAGWSLGLRCRQEVDNLSLPELTMSNTPSLKSQHLQAPCCLCVCFALYQNKYRQSIFFFQISPLENW